MVLFLLFSKGFGCSKEFAVPAMKSVLYHLAKEGTKESGSFIIQIFRILKTFAAACCMIVFQIQSWGNLNYFYFFRTKINMVKLRRNIFIHG